MPQHTATNHFDRAVRLDAEGRYDDAVNELALGTRANDLNCMMHLGIRLFAGDRAPSLPDEGMQFLSEAWEKGHSQAAARIAGLIALGVHAPSNWPLALEWLVRAAEKSWEPAQRQLLALCDDRELAARSSGAAQTNWRQIAAAVQLQEWRLSPDAVIKSHDPRVSTFPGFVRPELCRFFISLADGRLEPARVYDPVAQQDIVIAHRSNTLATFGIGNIEFAQVLLQTKMSVACGVPERHMEGPSVLHYAPGEQIGNHYDFVDPKSTQDYAGEIARNGQRVITFLIYLNDDYAGGETSFPDLGVIHKGTTGEGIYFVNALADLSPDLRMLHAGNPTSQGEKWLVTQFVRSRPMR
jgi:prolyl 4-hydroxylase